MQKKVYMTVDGNRRETTSLVLKASDNTQKTASLEADVTLDLEAKALGTVNLGQSYTVNPSTGKDGMSKVTFNVPAAPSGDAPNYQTKDLGSVNAGQHYDVSADSGYDALALVSFDVPAAQGGANLPARQTLVESVPEDMTFAAAVAGKTIPLSHDAGMVIISQTGSNVIGEGSTFVKMIIFYNKSWGEGKTGYAYSVAIVKGVVLYNNGSVSVEDNNAAACTGNMSAIPSSAYLRAPDNVITFHDTDTTWESRKVAAGNNLVYVDVAMDGHLTQLV